MIVPLSHTAPSRASRIRVSTYSLLLLLPLLLFRYPAQTSGALTYDEYNETLLGHTRNSAGSFIFGDLHDDEDAPPEVTADTMMIVFEGFSLFAKAVVESVQTQSFPYDLLRRMMYNSYDESEIIAYQTNIIITCVVVALIIVAIITLMVVYTVVHWRAKKNNRFALKKQLFDQKRGRIIIIVGFWFGMGNLIFLMCSLMVSTATNTAVTDMETDISGGMDGVEGYFNHSGEQWNFMSNDTNIWALITVLQTDVNDIGSLIWQPAVQSFSASLSSPFTATANLDAELAEAVGYLDDMQNQINSIVTGTGGNLSAIMAEIYYNLTFARKDFTCFGCDGSCSGCSDIIVDDIYFNMDFSSLTNVTSHLQSLQTMMNTVVADSLIEPEYYFWKGVGDYIESQTSVSSGMAGLNTSIENYAASISGSTNNILTPDESDLKFDRLRSDWKTWYESAKGQDGARYAFHLIFAMINIVMLMVLYFGWALLVKPGLYKLKPEDDNFKLPRLILLVCLVTSLCLSIGFLCLSVAGFYAAANTEKAVCQPARDGQIINETIDYTDGIPGHEGLYLSSILLGNGSLFPLYASEILDTCRANNTTSYSTFRQDLVAPNILTDLNYAPFFVNVSTYFDSMYIKIDNVTLVPPLFEEWFSNFTTAAFFNLTEYDEFLNKGVINANLDTFVSNLLVVYGHAYPDGPMEPAKSRLYEAAQSLMEQEPELNYMTELKDNVTTVFNSYSTLVNNMYRLQAIGNLNTGLNWHLDNACPKLLNDNSITGALNDLKAQEPALQELSDDYITSGVDQHRVTFLEQLFAIQDQSQQWVDEVGPCRALANSYDMVLNSFCNKFSDNANATWMLVGITVFFLLLLSLTSFLLYREIPQETGDDLEEDLDIKTEFPKVFGYKSGCWCCMNTLRPKKDKYRAESRPQTATSSVGRGRRKSSVGIAR